VVLPAPWIFTPSLETGRDPDVMVKVPAGIQSSPLVWSALKAAIRPVAVAGHVWPRLSWMVVVAADATYGTLLRQRNAMPMIASRLIFEFITHSSKRDQRTRGYKRCRLFTGKATVSSEISGLPQLLFADKMVFEERKKK